MYEVRHAAGTGTGRGGVWGLYRTAAEACGAAAALAGAGHTATVYTPAGHYCTSYYPRPAYTTTGGAK